MKLPVLPPLPYTLGELVKKVQDLITKTNQQVNDLSEGRMTATHNALTAAPTTGTWNLGDYMKNSNPSEAGAAASKYVIHGWICTVAGTPGTWLQDRRLTGN